MVINDRLGMTQKSQGRDQQAIRHDANHQKGEGNKERGINKFKSFLFLHDPIVFGVILFLQKSSRYFAISDQESMNIHHSISPSI